MDILSINDRPGSYTPSYYAATAKGIRQRPAFAGAQQADLVIIGAGYTGLNCALEAAKEGLEVVVLEANRAGWGASGRNGGQLGSGQRRGQEEIEAHHGNQVAQQMWALGEEAKAHVRGLIKDHQIDCDLKSGFMHTVWHRHEVAGLERETAHLQTAYAYDQLTLLDANGVADQLGTNIYAAGVIDWGAGHLHPLNYALGLARAAEAAGAVIYENSKVISADCQSGLVRTEQGEIKARHIAFACNGYLGGLERRIGARVMPINNFIVATEPMEEAQARAMNRDDLAVFDSKFVVNYFRMSADNRLLFGGGESYGYRFPSDIEKLVRKNMRQVYPQTEALRVEYAWGGTLGITTSRLPHFGRLDRCGISAAGYSGHGVAMASLSGKIMARAILGDAGKFDLFADLPPFAFPGGARLRHPILVLAMSWYRLRDRLGI